MNIEQEQVGQVTVMAPSGRIDSHTAKAFERRVLDAIDAGSHQMLLDLGGVDYMASAGLRVLLMALKRLQAAGGKLVLCSLGDRVREVLTIAGFAAVLDIRPDRSTALADW